MDKSKTFDEYLKVKAIEKGIPLVGVFELTPQCTLDCTMCYVHLQSHQMHQPELKTEEWLSLIDQACDAGMLYAVLTGGECLLYPGFREIYDHLQSQGVLITVLTNGTLLDEETVSWLTRRSPQRVQVSVYGSSPEGYRNVTGSADAFTKVDHAIDLLIEADIPFNFAITASRQMMPDLEAILRYCESKKAGLCRVNSCPFESREETQREFLDYAPSLDEQVEIFRIQERVFWASHSDRVPDPADCETYSHKRNIPLPERGIVCMAGRYGFTVRWDGQMLPCATFPYSARNPLAEGFLASWSIINQRCKEYRNPVECIGCRYFSACRFCPGGHYMKTGEGHANPDVCEEGMRMVREGLRFIPDIEPIRLNIDSMEGTEKHEKEIC